MQSAKIPLKKNGGVLQGGMQSHRRQNSFGLLAGGGGLNRKLQPKPSGILSGNNAKIQNNFNPKQRRKYNELHGDWSKLRFQDPNHGKYYYSVCDMNLVDIRKQKTTITVDERCLMTEKEDYKYFEPAMQQQSQQNVIGMNEDDESQNGEEADGFDKKQSASIYGIKRTLWSQVILSSESQYTYDSTASCTIMALECALRLQLEHKNYVSSIIPDQQKIKEILRIASMYKSDVHTDVDDIMTSVTRYKMNLTRERFHQMLVPNWKELSKFVVSVGKEFKVI